MNIICLGSKGYKSIDISCIIDNYKTIRHNFQLPNNNNGTKFGQYVLCNHVWVYKDKTLENIIKQYGESSFSLIPNEHLIKWKLAFDNNQICNISLQSNNWQIFNFFLQSIKCPFIFNSLPRIGHISFMTVLLQNIKPLLFGYSLDNINDPHQYTKKIFTKKEIKNIVKLTCHDYKQEMKILIWLHENNYIDATLCSLIDNKIITFDCKIIRPTISCLNVVIKYFDKITLINIDDKYIENYKNIFNLSKEGTKIILHSLNI